MVVLHQELLPGALQGQEICVQCFSNQVMSAAPSARICDCHVLGSSAHHRGEARSWKVFQTKTGMKETSKQSRREECGLMPLLGSSANTLKSSRQMTLEEGRITRAKMKNKRDVVRSSEWRHRLSWLSRLRGQQLETVEGARQRRRKRVAVAGSSVWISITEEEGIDEDTSDLKPSQPGTPCWCLAPRAGGDTCLVAQPRRTRGSL
ncbi:uncharacterized protein LOC134145780 [Rhea pennata]|uniref:uncharacterized protein LOC134145780 n=1 Tax=Rhea pennata TaxID=8795 RepID=UPI002E265FAD